MKRNVTQCNAREDTEERIDDEGDAHARPPPAAKPGSRFELPAPPPYLTIDQERALDRAKQGVVCAEAGKRWFIRECEAAGMPADSPVSPSLLATLKRHSRSVGG